MLTSILRSRLVGLPNKPFLRSRVFSTAPVHRLPFQRLPFNVERALRGELGLTWTPEIVTMESIAKAFIYCSHTDCDNAASLARAKASLTEKDAHNCNLLFTSDHLKSLPKLGFNIWRLQAGTAHKIVQYHQHQALLRAGILVSSTTATRIVLEIQTVMPTTIKQLA